MGRQCADERSSARDDDFFLATLKGPAGCASARDLARVGPLRRKGIIASSGKMQHGFIAYVRCERTREVRSGVFAGHHNQHGLRRVSETGCNGERARRRSNAERRVASCVEFAVNRRKRLAFAEGSRKRVNEHAAALSLEGIVCILYVLPNTKSRIARPNGLSITKRNGSSMWHEFVWYGSRFARCGTNTLDVAQICGCERPRESL